MRKIIYLILMLHLANILPPDAFAQEALPPRPSPLNVVRIKYQDNYLKIVYSQPHKQGRKIFGELVPYGKVWRTGANEATEITFTRDIRVGTELLKAGTYTLFSIPQENQWTIIFNADLGLWGAYNYNDAKDVLRITAPVIENERELYEPFTIRIDQQNDKAEIVFLWERVIVKLPLTLLQTKS
ncbi:MAG TPA: DUF2911 domain-containing protein [Cyclobacteriaceae bacterium]|nr:DUF2911 domain-containing protein [Cyclobacteriaceae bacterium]